MKRKPSRAPPTPGRRARTKVRIDLVNPQELLELPGIRADQAAAIVTFRVEHGPIQDATQLAAILGVEHAADSLLARVDFSPSDSTAPEAPGA
jgi:hypothetical protein